MKLPSRIKTLAGLLLTCVLLLIMLRWFEHSLVYHPDRRLSATGAELGRPFEEVFFTTSDGLKLSGWFFPAQTNSPRARLAVLVCHGNAGNISHRLNFCEAFLQTGANVFVFDYRGYGLSHGRPSEQGTYLDGQAALNWLQQKGISAAKIIVFGESLGGGVASELALRAPLAGLILQSTFTSIPAIGAELYPWLPVRWISTIRYDTLAKLPRIRVPILVMHSRSDGLIGFHHAETNYATANGPKMFWELKGEHNDPLADRANFIAGVEKFLELIESRMLPASKEENRVEK